MAKIIPPKITSGYLCDEQPTAESTNLMTSGDIYTALENVSIDPVEFDLNDLVNTNTEVQTAIGLAFLVALSDKNTEHISSYAGFTEEALALYDELVSAVNDGKKIVFTGDITAMSQKLGSVKMDAICTLNDGNIGVGGSGRFPYVYPLDGELYLIKFDFSVTKVVRPDETEYIAVAYTVVANSNVE